MSRNEVGFDPVLHRSKSRWRIFAMLIVLGATFVHERPSQAQRPPAPLHQTGLTLLDEKAYKAIDIAKAPLSGAIQASYDIPGPGSRIVGQQGDQKSCAGWAAAYDKTYQESLERHWTDTDSAHRFSPAYIYNQVARGTCGGINFVDALRTLYSGAGTLDFFDYDDKTCSRQPTSDERARSLPFRIEQPFGRVTFTVSQIKGNVAANNPVLVGVSLMSDFHDIIGEAVYDNRSPVQTNDYHGMLIIGYDDGRGGIGAFHVINSWGPKWGANGLAWVSYASMLARIREAYVLRDHVEQPLSPTELYVSPDQQLLGDVRYVESVTYDGDVALTARNLILEDGVVIRVRHGARLVVDAVNILVDGSAAIDGTGDVGETGRDGIALASDAVPSFRSKTDLDFWGEQRRLRTSTPPSLTAVGGKGADGGPGATIVLPFNAPSGLTVAVAGGKGGRGGRGAVIEHLANGRDPLCSSCTIDERAAEGPPGQQGPAGKVVVQPSAAVKRGASNVP